MASAESDSQWLVLRYELSPDEAQNLADAFSSIDFHSFTTASRCDALLDVVLYGRQGQLPAAVWAILEPWQAVEQQQVDEQQLISHADSLSPVELCPGVLLVPEGATTATTACEALRLRLAPGPAFGDGRHPTTRAAARLMRGCSWDQQVVYDVGSGSGVLGLLAKALGAHKVCFGDIDQDAVRTCIRSCQLNDYDSAQVLRSDLLQSFPQTPVDTVLANIYAELLLQLLDSRELAAVLPQGRLLLSGISHGKVATVRQHLSAHGFTIIAEDQEAWWYAIHAQR